MGNAESMANSGDEPPSSIPMVAVRRGRSLSQESVEKTTRRTRSISTPVGGRRQPVSSAEDIPDARQRHRGCIKKGVRYSWACQATNSTNPRNPALSAKAA